VAGKPPAHNHHVPFSHHEVHFVAKLCGKRLDQREETFAAGLDVCAVLNVVGRPVLFGRPIVALAEQGVECFEDDRLVPVLFCLSHLMPSFGRVALGLPFEALSRARPSESRAAARPYPGTASSPMRRASDLAFTLLALTATLAACVRQAMPHRICPHAVILPILDESV
jgi:hypothetical protein